MLYSRDIFLQLRQWWWSPACLDGSQSFGDSSLARKLKARSLGLSSNLAWACLFMSLSNVLLSLLYYRDIYSPEGTSKPSWTKDLGRIFIQL